MGADAVDIGKTIHSHPTLGDDPQARTGNSSGLFVKLVGVDGSVKVAWFGVRFSSVTGMDAGARFR